MQGEPVLEVVNASLRSTGFLDWLHDENLYHPGKYPLS